MPSEPYQLNASMRVPLPRGRVFAFFAQAENLERITPPRMCFEILSPRPVEIREGALIDYRLRLLRLPFRWRTRISVWDPPNEFVDVQERGPYAEWSHRHLFSDDAGGGTIVEDRVRYRLPLGLPGRLAHPFVRRQLQDIFRYRQEAVMALLVGGPAGP